MILSFYKKFTADVNGQQRTLTIKWNLVVKKDALLVPVIAIPSLYLYNFRNCLQTPYGHFRAIFPLHIPE
jgi:hypothetical protein